MTDTYDHDAAPTTRPGRSLDAQGGVGLNTGHGHVFPRPDGARARCGGPGMCSSCSTDATRRTEAAGEALAAAIPVKDPALAAAYARTIRKHLLAAGWVITPTAPQKQTRGTA